MEVLSNLDRPMQVRRVDSWDVSEHPEATKLGHKMDYTLGYE